jgi:hypothetical protein
MPLEKQCLANALALHPETRAKAHLWFHAVDDPAGGALVDAVDLQEDTSVDDAALRTCVIESLMTIDFEETLAGRELVVDLTLELPPSDEPADAG